MYKAALPAGLKLESETMVEWCASEEAATDLSDKEQRVCQLLVDKQPHAIAEINKVLDGKDAFPLVKRLLTWHGTTHRRGNKRIVLKWK